MPELVSLRVTFTILLENAGSEIDTTYEN